MWQNWKLKSESSPLGKVKPQHLPVRSPPGTHGGPPRGRWARSSGSATPNRRHGLPAGAPCLSPRSKASHAAGSSGRRHLRQAGRQARAAVIPGAAPHSALRFPTAGLGRPAPAGLVGALLQRHLLTPVSVPFWGLSHRHPSAGQQIHLARLHPHGPSAFQGAPPASITSGSAPM